MRRPPKAQSNAVALEITLAELTRAGRLERIDSAHVQAARAMAVELDRFPGKATLWREYHIAIERLRADDTGSDDIAKLLAELSSPVRDSA